MPNIMLKKSSISAISRQIERMQSETEDAEKKIRSALNGLDFEVASKQNIRNCLNSLITSANRQGNLSGQYKNAFLNVTNSVTEGDSKYGNRSQSILEKIKTFVEDTTKKFKDLFMRNRLAKISAVTGLFIISPITVITVADIKLLEKIASIVKGWKQTPGEAIPITPPGILEKYTEKETSETDENDLNSTDETNSAPADNIPNENVQTNGNIKGYTGSSKDLTAGAYGDYNVIQGFDEKYVYCQKNSDNSDFRANGCVSTSDAMVGAMTKGHDVNPEITFVNGQTTWGNAQTDAIPGSKTWSAERRYTEIYNQINSGNAVVIRVTGHSMVAVGVKNGCDPNNMSAADVLIANPGTGKISNLQEYLTSSRRQLDNSWSLRVAK